MVFSALLIFVVVGILVALIAKLTVVTLLLLEDGCPGSLLHVLGQPVHQGGTLSLVEVAG